MNIRLPRCRWLAVACSKANIQGIGSINGITYADLAAAEGRAAMANEANGNMKLLPMLEIRMDAQGSNLPPQSDLTPYGVIVNNLTVDGSQQVAYVPLALITDEQTGAECRTTGQCPDRGALLTQGRSGNRQHNLHILSRR